MRFAVAIARRTRESGRADITAGVDEGGDRHLGFSQENAAGGEWLRGHPMSTASPDAARQVWWKPVLLALATTVAVTALSYLLPENYAATGVGLAFLAATYAFALR